VFALSVGIALAGVLVGTLVSFRFDLPTSPAIICCYAVAYLGAAAWCAVGTRKPWPAG
jgi:ABC-type Mn2+/Zn2+ transport system permease subunit